MGDIFHFVKLLYKLGLGTQDFLQDAQASPSLESPARATTMRRAYRRIVRISAIALVVGTFVVPCAAPWVGVWKYGITPADAPYRMLMGMIISAVAIPAHLYAGVAAGSLTVPKVFLQGPAGASWMRLIGAKSITGARLISLLVVLAVSSLWAGISVAQIKMAPFVR